MHRPRRSRHLVVALYANAVLLAIILVVLLSRNDAPSLLPAAYAQNQPAIAGGAGMFMMPAQFSKDAFGCYLMDVDAQTLCAYQFFPGEKQLRLIAARNFRYDRRLNDFNTGKPSPLEVKDLIEQQQGGTRSGAAPREDAPAGGR